MTHTSKISLIITAGLFALSACATAAPALEDHAPTFGEAVSANMEAQKVAPTAAQKANTYIPADPSRRALARSRYKKDDVETPKPVGTMN